MATTSKKFRADEINNIVTNVHETLPVTGSLVSDSSNVKEYSHKRYISVYDSAPALASSNQLMDISYCSKTSLNSDSTVKASREAMYKQFAQVLTGFDTDGSLKGLHVSSGGSTQELTDFFVIALPRYLVKDKINNDTSKLQFTYSGSVMQSSGSSNMNSPAGEFYELETDKAGVTDNSGLLFVEAGVMVVSKDALVGSIPITSGGQDIDYWANSGSYDDVYTLFRENFDNLSFQNTVEVNSTIYTCQVSFGDFNYSNNPTFTDASGSIPAPSDKKTYITGIGLHGPAGELLATAKLSQPKEKTNAKNYLFNVRLDY